LNIGTELNISDNY